MNRKTTYIPVSNVRFAAMAAIIFVHSFFFSFSAGKEIHTSDIFIIILSDAFKFGTLCFFLISGYLLSVKLDEYDSREFLTRRARTIAAPWLTWSSLLVIALAIKSTLKGETWNFSEIVKNVVFTSEYWFVLNYFIALILILTFRSIKHSIAGIIFASLSIFYSANIYLKIIPTIHTTAIFGYLFFLWFGRQVRNKNNKLINRFMETNRWKLVLLAITLYGLSVTESFLIKTTLGTKYESNIYFNDPLNILRISNQLYALTIFALLFSRKKAVYPKLLQPRNETFGLYLIHWPVLLFITALGTRIASKQLNIPRVELIKNFHIHVNSATLVLGTILTFVSTYLLTLIIVKTIKETRFSWMIGKI